MVVLSSFRSRNLLALVVPAILAFLSAYWFHKKRKLKKNNEAILDPQVAACVVSESDTPSDQGWTSSNNTSCAQSNDYRLTTDESEESVLNRDEADPVRVTRTVEVNAADVLENCLSSLTADCVVIAESSVDVPLKLEDSDESRFSFIHNDIVSVESCSLVSEETADACTTKTYLQSLNDNALQDDTSPDVSKVIVDSQKEPISISSLESNLICSTECNSKENGDAEGLGEHLVQELPSSNERCSSPEKGTNSSTDVTELPLSEGDLPNGNNIAPKNSPASTGSPVSHSNDTGSDCEALSSVGTSSISLSELFSTSPIDSVKEQTNFQVDAFVNEDSSNDSGKGSTLNLDPVSSCSMSSELEDVSSREETRRNDFRFSRRSNADVLCRQGLNSTERSGEISEQYNYYSDSNCNPSRLLTKHVDASGEIAAVSSNSCDMDYVQVIDSKTFETSTTDHYVYEFELPQELCGRLIGRQGKNVKFIKEHSNATVYIKRHPYNVCLKIAVIEGSRSDVNSALELLRKKFPPSQFPTLSLAQTNLASSALGVPVPESLQLQLPENTSIDVILSSMVNAGHFFLQQPTHPTYPSLSTLDQCMMACYSQGDTPQLPQPLEAGVICAASIMGGWYRAQVIYVSENSEDCEVKFVDYGGYSQVPISSLRQIRSDFMTLPFQASECYLAKVHPLTEYGWSAEASATFEELAQGQILQAVIVSYHEDGVPYVYLYRVQGITSTFINRELVSRGLAKWIEHH